MVAGEAGKGGGADEGAVGFGVNPKPRGEGAEGMGTGGLAPKDGPADPRPLAPKRGEGAPGAVGGAAGANGFEKNEGAGVGGVVLVIGTNCGLESFVSVGFGDVSGVAS